MANLATNVIDVNEATVGAALAGPLPPVPVPWPFLLENLPPAETAANADFAVLAEIAVNNGPISGMVLTPAGDRLLVANYGTNSVSVIDTATLAVTSTIGAIDEPFVLAAADDGAYVSTVSASYDAIALIDTDTNTVIGTQPLALSVRDLVTSPDGKYVYASRTGPDGADVAVIDATGDPVATIDVASGPGASAEALGISPDGRNLYVATLDEFGGSLVVVDTAEHRVVDSVIIGAPIRGVALSRHGDAAYVISYDLEHGGTVDVIETSTNEITDSVVIGGSPTQLALGGAGSRAYVVVDDEVAVLCTVSHEIIENISVGAQPSFVAESPDGERLYVADYAGGVTVLSVDSALEALLARMMAFDVIR
jgi:YVTN family beta-propeller protein